MVANTQTLPMVLRSIVILLLAFATMAALLLLAGCGGPGLGKKPDTTVAEAVDLSRPDTPENRAVQVAWTAARAQYCAFGMNRDKLRADYLAFERKRGAPVESLQQLERTYDVTFQTFFARVKEIPDYCSPQRIAEIRPDINRHLKGDYSPSPRKQQKPTQDEYLPPLSDAETLPDYWKDDPAQHMEQ